MLKRYTAREIAPQSDWAYYEDAVAAIAAETVRADRAEEREQADRDAWARYLKVGETPLDRLAREIADNHAVCVVLAHRTAERDALRFELDKIKAIEERRHDRTMTLLTTSFASRKV